MGVPAHVLSVTFVTTSQSPGELLRLKVGLTTALTFRVYTSVTEQVVDGVGGLLPQAAAAARTRTKAMRPRRRRVQLRSRIEYVNMVGGPFCHGQCGAAI